MVTVSAPFPSLVTSAYVSASFSNDTSLKDSVVGAGPMLLLVKVPPENVIVVTHMRSNAPGSHSAFFVGRCVLLSKSPVLLTSITQTPSGKPISSPIAGNAAQQSNDATA